MQNLFTKNNKLYIPIVGQRHLNLYTLFVSIKVVPIFIQLNLVLQKFVYNFVTLIFMYYSRTIFVRNICEYSICFYNCYVHSYANIEFIIYGTYHYSAYVIIRPYVLVAIEINIQSSTVYDTQNSSYSKANCVRVNNAQRNIINTMRIGI